MRSSRIILAAICAAVLIVAVTGCSRASDKKVDGSGLSPAERAEAASTEGTALATDSAAVKQPSAVGTTTPGGKTSESGSALAPAPGSFTPAKPTTPAKPAVPGAKSGMTVKILFWNDTNSKRLSGTQIRIGSAIFKPNTGVKQTRGSLGPVAYDKPIDLIVYPDGPAGKKVVVPLTVSRQMVSNSEQDGIHVAISDGTVRVLGNPVVNVDRSQPRF